MQGLLGNCCRIRIRNSNSYTTSLKIKKVIQLSSHLIEKSCGDTQLFDKHQRIEMLMRYKRSLHINDNSIVTIVTKFLWSFPFSNSEKSPFVFVNTQL
jgi:hypothetical protein